MRRYTTLQTNCHSLTKLHDKLSTTSPVCWVRLPRCQLDKKDNWHEELCSRRSQNMAQSAGWPATTLAITADIHAETKDLLFVWMPRVHLKIFNSRYINELITLLFDASEDTTFWWDRNGNIIFLNFTKTVQRDETAMDTVCELFG